MQPTAATAAHPARPRLRPMRYTVRPLALEAKATRRARALMRLLSPRGPRSDPYGLPSMAGSSHFSYHALEGSTGALRWAHKQSDFHKPLHGDEHFTPQMDYKLDLEAVGGGEAVRVMRGAKPPHL